MSNKMKHCCYCDEILDINNFYKTRSKIYKDGRLHLCKKCIGDLINKYLETYDNLHDVLMIICSITNTLIVKELFNDTLKEFSKSRAKKMDMYGSYLELLEKYIVDNATWTKTNITFECSPFTSNPFKNCVMDEDLEKIADSDIVININENEEDDNEIELTQQQRKKLVKKWGDVS